MPTATALFVCLDTLGPYLGDTVLKAALLLPGNPMSETQWLQILGQNSSLSPGVWQAVQARQPTFSASFMSDLQALQNNSSARLNLEEELHSLWVHTRNAANIAVGNYLYQAMLADSLADWEDSALAVLEYMGQREDLLQLVPTYIRRGDMEKAQSALATLGTSDAELQDFATLAQIQISWKQQQLNALQAGNTDKATIEALAAAEHPAAYLARSLQKLMAEVNYTYQPEEAEAGSGTMQALTTGQGKIVQLDNKGAGILNVYPNPAQDALIISYKLPPTTNRRTRVEIFDMTGHTLFTQYIPGHTLQGTLKVNTSLLAAGIYYCKATTEGRTLSIVKVAVTH